MTTRNESGKLMRVIRLMMPLESVLDRFASAELEKHLPSDARVIPGSGSIQCDQLRMTLESVEFMPVPHGNIIPELTAEKLSKRGKV